MTGSHYRRMTVIDRSLRRYLRSSSGRSRRTRCASCGFLNVHVVAVIGVVVVVVSLRHPLRQRRYHLMFTKKKINISSLDIKVIDSSGTE